MEARLSECFVIYLLLPDHLVHGELSEGSGGLHHDPAVSRVQELPLPVVSLVLQQLLEHGPWQPLSASGQGHQEVVVADVTLSGEGRSSQQAGQVTLLLVIQFVEGGHQAVFCRNRFYLCDVAELWQCKE